MVADPFRQLRGNDPVPAQDDQEDGDGEMCREEQVPEGLDTRCIRLDISAGEIVELMNHPGERSAAQEKKAERDPAPAPPHPPQPEPPPVHAASNHPGRGKTPWRERGCPDE